MNKPELSIVVPVYNEAESLPTLAAEIQAALAPLEIAYEVLLVDDGSSDGSWREIAALAAAGDGFRGVRLAHNQGQSAALAAGFTRAAGKVIVTLDADLQNDPADIPRLLTALEGWDAVSGIRARRHDSWLRRVSSRIANRVRRRVLDDGITDVGCSLKAYRAELLDDLPVFDGMHRFLPALVKMKGARISELEVHHRPRLHGEAKYNVRNRLWRGLADLAAVAWMQKRRVRPDRVAQVTGWEASADEPGPADR